MNKDKVYLKGYVLGHAADTLGYQGLLVQLENLDVVEIDKDLVHKEVDEPQLIKLKDIIARIKGFDSDTQIVWLDAILNELGSDYGILKYKTGYEQGRFEGEYVGQQLKDADKVRQELNKPVVKQFVADWIKYCKNTNVTMTRALLVGEVDFYNYANQKDLSRLTDFFSDGKNQEIFARAWLDGYTVEKEKRYFVRLKHAGISNSLLKRTPKGEWWFGINFDDDESQAHTRKELEKAGFGWVIDCPGIEIEEVEE